MKEDLPPDNRAELEARVTALLLGELSAEDAAALRQTISQDAALAKLHERLRQTLDLVRETAAISAGEISEQTAPLKLSPARREALLAHFKTIAPKELARPRARRVSLIVELAALAVIGLIVAGIYLPKLTNVGEITARRGTSRRLWSEDSGDTVAQSSGHRLRDMPARPGTQNRDGSATLASSPVSTASTASTPSTQPPVAMKRARSTPAIEADRAGGNVIESPLQGAGANRVVRAYSLSPSGEVVRTPSSGNNSGVVDEASKANTVAMSGGNIFAPVLAPPVVAARPASPPRIPIYTGNSLENGDLIETDVDRIEAVPTQEKTDGVDSPLKAAGNTTNAEVYFLKYADAKAVASELKDVFRTKDQTAMAGNPFAAFLGRGGRGGDTSDEGGRAGEHVNAVSDDRNNAVIINAPAALMPGISNVISQLDIPQEDTTQTKLFYLTNADSTATANELRALFPDSSQSSLAQNSGRRGAAQFGGAAVASPGSDGGPRRQGTVNAVADPSTQSLLVTASQDTLDQIEQIVGVLDSSPSGHAETYGNTSANSGGDVSLPQRGLSAQNGRSTSTSSQLKALQQRMQTAAQQSSVNSTTTIATSRGGGGGGSFGGRTGGVVGGGIGGAGGTMGNSLYATQGQVGPATFTIDPISGNVTYITAPENQTNVQMTREALDKVRKDNLDGSQTSITYNGNVATVYVTKTNVVNSGSIEGGDSWAGGAAGTNGGVYSLNAVGYINVTNPGHFYALASEGLGNSPGNVGRGTGAVVSPTTNGLVAGAFGGGFGGGGAGTTIESVRAQGAARGRGGRGGVAVAGGAGATNFSMPYVSTPDTVVVAGLQAQRAAGMEDFQTATHDDFQMGFDASRRTLGYNDRNAALASPVATNRFFAATPDFTAGDIGAAHFILTNGAAVNQVNRLNLDGSAAQSFGGFNSSVSFSNALSTSQIEDLYAVSENAGSLSVPRTNGAPRDLENHRIGGATSYAAAVTNSGPMASWDLFVEDNGAPAAKAEGFRNVGGFNGAYMKLAGEMNGGVLPNAATTNGWSEVAQVLPPPERSMKVASGNANPTAPKLGEVTINGVIGAQAGTAPSYTGNPTYANPSGIFPGAGPAGSNPGQTAPAASDGSLTGTAVRTLAAPVPPISAAAAAEVERRGLVPQAATIPRDATNHGWTGVSPYLATAAVPAPLATRNPQSLPAGQAGAIRKLAEAATTNGPPVEPADIHYHLSMPADQVLNEVYGPLVGRTPLPATGPAAADLNKKVITLDTKSPLTKTEAITALETVLGMNGITVVPIGDKSLRAVTDANAATEGGLMISNTAATLPDAGKFSTEIVQLKHADPDQLLAALRSFASASKQSVIYIPSTKSLILRDNAENVKRMLETVEKLDVETSLTTKANVNKPLSKPAVPPPVPQPEVQTRDNAFSTFSLNVSDVSFKLAAASLQNGLMPDAATVRSEEFINAFDYRDSEPAPGAPIGFAAERAGWPFAHNRDLLRFAVKAAAEGRQAGRPLNLVLLLDKSGSMERADRVAIIREALRVLATQLKAQDTVSVVVFARTARLFADGVSGIRFGALAAELEAITPEGGTNLEEAMRLAYETALRHYLASGENRVVVLTDGAANLGDVEPEGLKKRVEANRAQGIALDCFGVGWEDYNDTLLETLSRSGGGRYGFVNTPEEAATEFAGQLAGALRVAASDVKVQVEFNPDRVISWRQIGYAKDQLTKEQFRDNSVKAAQIAVAESGNALYTVELNPAGVGPVCVVYVRYRAPGTSEYFERAWAVPYTGAAPALDKATPAMRLAAASSAFSEWLAGSPYAGEVTLTQLQGYLGGVPEFYGADTRPRQLETMLREARSISGK